MRNATLLSAVILASLGASMAGKPVQSEIGVPTSNRNPTGTQMTPNKNTNATRGLAL